MRLLVKVGYYAGFRALTRMPSPETPTFPPRRRRPPTAPGLRTKPCSRVRPPSPSARYTKAAARRYSRCRRSQGPVTREEADPQRPLVDPSACRSRRREGACEVPDRCGPRHPSRPTLPARRGLRQRRTWTRPGRKCVREAAPSLENRMGALGLPSPRERAEVATAVDLVVVLREPRHGRGENAERPTRRCPLADRWSATLRRPRVKERAEPVG